MKKLSAVLIIIIVVLSFVSGYFLYQISDLEREKSDLQNRNSELENQIFDLESQIDELQSVIDKHTDVVKITDFRMYGGLNPVAGMTYDSQANITIRNFGINDVENLSLFILYGNTTVLHILVHNGTNWIPSNNQIPIELLHVNEELKFTTRFLFVLSENGGQFVARISLNDKIVDEYCR